MTDHIPAPDTMCTCGHGAASAHDIDNSVSAFTACVVSGCTCKAFTPAPEAATRAVQGYCPACGGSSLFLGDGGYVTCARLDCPVPDAASTLLETDPRTTPGAPATNPCRARTASDVHIQHDVTRKAMCDALGAGWHLNWQQIIDTAQRSHAANTEWQREDEEHRTAVSGALGLGTGAPWDAITERAREVAADLAQASATAAAYAAADSADAAAGSYAHRAEQAEAALNRVWDLADRWEHALAADLPYARALRRALDGEQLDAQPEAPCFHPSWETEPTVGARRCTDCGEWLDPEPTPVEPVPVFDALVADLFAAVRHAWHRTR